MYSMKRPPHRANGRGPGNTGVDPMPQAQSSSTRRLVGRPGHNRGVQHPPQVYGPETVAAINATFTKGALGDRNRALTGVLYRAGARIGEALAINLADVDLQARTVLLKGKRPPGAKARGEGPKLRTVGIDAETVLLIERWLASRARAGVPKSAPLFCTLSGKPWSPQAVRECLKRAASKAGVTARVHPHGFRHSHAVRLDEAGTRVSVISRQLGHASVATTGIYLDHVSPVQLVAAVDAASF